MSTDRPRPGGEKCDCGAVLRCPESIDRDRCIACDDPALTAAYREAMATHGCGVICGHCGREIRATKPLPCYDYDTGAWYHNECALDVARQALRESDVTP